MTGVQTCALPISLRLIPGVEVLRHENSLVARTQRGLPQRVILAGHIDTVPIADKKEFEGKPELVQANDGGMWYLLFNTNVKPLNNAKVRKAISMAINKEELVQKTLDNSEKNVKSFVPSGIGIKGLEKDFAEEEIGRAHV